MVAFYTLDPQSTLLPSSPLDLQSSLPIFLSTRAIVFLVYKPCLDNSDRGSHKSIDNLTLATIKIFILNHRSKNSIIAIVILIINRAFVPLLNDMASHIFVLVDYASWILSMCNQMVRQRGVAKFVRILPERRYGNQQYGGKLSFIDLLNVFFLTEQVRKLQTP